MNPLKGFFAPSAFFNDLANKDPHFLRNYLVKKIILLCSFFTVLAYLSINTIIEQSQSIVEHSPALYITSNVFIFFIMTFLIRGCFTSAVGKLFNVDEYPSRVIATLFWAQIYGWLIGIVVSIFLYVVVILLTSNPIFALITTFSSLLLVRYFYIYKAIAASLKTSRLESLFVIILSSILNYCFAYCLAELIKTFLL